MSHETGKRHLPPAAVFLFLCCTVFFAVSACGSAAQRRFYDLENARMIEGSLLLPRLKEKRVVLVGEHHTAVDHHRVQLEVIQMLHNAGVPVAVGLEMFRHDAQNALDGWISGRINENGFQTVYSENWSYDWSLYRDIFRFCRDNGIPMVGLNVPREITRQVARKGYQSLSRDQIEKLGDVACRVDEKYMEFIRSAYGGHAHGNMRFLYFCEAQMVWDSAMAVNALAYLKANPGRSMVLLAGTGHVRKQAIPAQIRKRAEIPVGVILPEIPGSIDKKSASIEDADFLFVDPDVQ